MMTPEDFNWGFTPEFRLFCHVWALSRIFLLDPSNFLVRLESYSFLQRRLMALDSIAIGFFHYN